MAALDEGPDQFEMARKKAAQQNTAAVQGQQDALKRRFAALGSINSGAAIKQSQMAAEAGEQNLASQNENINAAQRAENLRVKELQANRDFTRSERLGSQDFAGSQADLGRKFQTGERLGSQDFMGQQNKLGREFTTSERLGGQEFAGQQAKQAQDFTAGQNDAQRALQSKQFDADLNFRNTVRSDQNSQFDQQMTMANRQFQEDQATTAFNKALADEEAHKKNGGILGSIFGDSLPSTGFGGQAVNAFKGSQNGGMVLGPVGQVVGAIGGFGGGGGGGGGGFW